MHRVMLCPDLLLVVYVGADQEVVEVCVACTIIKIFPS